jgi:GNAT superfamily N-acetyltransferase
VIIRAIFEITAYPTMPDFTLVQLPDTSELLQFMRRFYEVDHIDFREAVARSAIEKMLADESKGRIWWIQEGEERIGYVAITFCFSLEFGGPSAVVDELYLEESHRGRGIGFEALRFVERFCAPRGILALHLEVDRGNLHAQALYQKAGYHDRSNYLLTKWLSDESNDE